MENSNFAGKIVQSGKFEIFKNKLAFTNQQIKMAFECAKNSENFQ